METFTIIAITVVVIIFIIIIVLIFVLLPKGNNNPPTTNNNKSIDPAPAVKVRYKLNTQCENDDDCESPLVCIERGNSTIKLCSNKIIPNLIPIQVIPIQNIPIQNIPIPDEIIKEVIRSPTVREAIKQDKDNTIKRKYRIEELSDSDDDERNSEGYHSDVAFDVRSDMSTDNIEEVSTPCEEQDGIYFCRSYSTNIIDKETHSPVIDVCSYSSSTVFLLDDGNIIHENKTRIRVNNNIKLTRIASYDGYLYGISYDKKLYTLPNSYFATTSWMWSLVGWAPINIIQISTTLDSKYLWLQDNTKGYLYNDKITKTVEISGIKRVYGKDENNYIEIDNTRHTAMLYPNKIHIKDIYDAALSYYNEVVAIQFTDSKKFRGITIINWKPYYIRN